MTELDVLRFFEGDPEGLALYEAFARRVLEKIGGEVQIKVQKTQIAFSARRGFAFVSRLPVRRAADRPEHFITVTFGLDHRLDSPRIDGAVEPYPNRWTHHVMVGSPDEIDDELMAWVGEAAAFSRNKR